MSVPSTKLVRAAAAVDEPAYAPSRLVRRAVLDADQVLARAHAEAKRLSEELAQQKERLRIDAERAASDARDAARAEVHDAFDPLLTRLAEQFTSQQESFQTINSSHANRD